MDEFIGIVKLFAGSFAPRDWALCNGQLLSISNYPAVFSILGTTYGGDGINTFALPDLRGRVPLGAGKGPVTSNYVAGQMSGTENVNLNVANLPAHSHAAQVLVSSGNATDATPGRGASIAAPGTLNGRNFTATLGFNSTAPDTALNPASATSASVGSGTAVNILQPYLAMNYIICLNGLFPTRP